MAWSLARPDWRERIRAGLSLMPDLPGLDQVRARRAIAVYDRLHIPDVEGKPCLGDAGAPWFREIVGALHGSLVGTPLKRLIESVFLLVPKKNSKTTNAAALMLTSLLINERPRAGFLLVGATQKIADTGFEQIEGMIEADKYLQDNLKVQPHLKTVTHRKLRAKLQIKSFNVKVLTGVKPAGAMVDELHLLGDMADADRVIGQLRGGIISQPEGFLIFITTQSERPPAGVFAAELKKARAIRDGTATGTMLPILYELPEDLTQPVLPGEIPAWHDTRLWRMVTPNDGRSITVARLAADFDEAKLSGDEEIRRWASQHLNIEIGLALLSDRWAGANYWEGRGDGPKTLGELIARSEVIVIGIDGGGLDDLLGFVAIGREIGTLRWLHWSHSWAHKSVLERRKSEAPKLRDFAQQGDLTIVDEYGADVVAVGDLVEEIKRSGKLAEKHAIGVDQAGIGQIVDEIGKREIDSTPEAAIVVGISQGWTLNGPIQTAARKLADGTLLHAGQPVMAWAVSNARVEPRGNAVLVTKQASGRAKIDPLMATFDAVALMSRNPPPAGSVYEKRGFVVFASA